jgi:hypothetical protein
MTINELQTMLSYKQKWRAEKAVGYKVNDDIWAAVQSLKKEYGKRANEWPEMWLTVLFPNKEESSLQPQAIEGGTGEKAGAPKHLENALKRGRRNQPQFHSLTEEDVEWITGVYSMEGTALEKYKAMFDRFGIEARTSGWWWSKLGLTSRKENEPDLFKAARNRDLPTKKYVLVTSAQNSSPVHIGFWKNIKAYAEFLDADIRVIPTRYRNPTSVFQDLDYDYWSPEVVPYLDLTNHQICPKLSILGALKIQPTAEFPLRELHAITNGCTAVVGHPKVHLESIPILCGEHQQRIWSTGAVTLENYTDSKAGAKGSSHHVFGCVIIEIDGGGFHIRHITATESGDFQDMWNVVSDGEVGFSDEITSAAIADVHLGDTDQRKMDSTVNLLNMLRPKHIALHDLFNGHSVNYHEAKDPVKNFHRIKKGRNLLADEVGEMLRWLHWFTQEFSKSEVVVVRSNHCLFLDRYISDRNWKEDLHNAQWYMKCLDHLLNNPDTKGLVPWFIEQEFGDRVTCLSRDTSYKPGAYQLANHGDLGVHGSKGSPLQYSKLNTKQITGHTHSPARINGLLVVGTSTHLKLDYNEGPSAWGWADVIEYKNGKATHIIYNEDYKFTTQKYPV